MKADRHNLAALIDHTYLKSAGAKDAVKKLCREAREYKFAAVMVHPCEVRRCRYLLDESEVKVGTVVGFPFGQNTTETKLFETEDAIRRGAQELDMVVNINNLLDDRLLPLKQELAGFAALCRKGGVGSKLIIETFYLDDERKVLACRLAVEAGIDFVKTSTGLAGGGATVADVKLMVEAVGGGALVKAAGGIRTYADARALVEAGAARIGTSAGVEIILGT